MADRVEEPVFHLALREEWEVARRSGVYDRSTIGRSLAEEGFIHCSFAHQLQATADRYARGRDDLVLLAIDADAVAEILRVEDSGRGEDFPHLYGPLPVAAVVATAPIPMADDGRLDVDVAMAAVTSVT